jgi:capping protein beta
MSPTSIQEPSGSWDSIHVFESVERGRQAHYKLTSTVMLQVTTRQASQEGGNNEKKSKVMATGSNTTKYKDISFKRQGEVTLSGSMTRQVRVPFFPSS